MNSIFNSSEVYWALKTKNIQLDESIINYAAINECWDVVKMLLDHKCPHNVMLIYYATSSGNKKILKWLSTATTIEPFEFVDMMLHVDKKILNNISDFM